MQLFVFSSKGREISPLLPKNIKEVMEYRMVCMHHFEINYLLVPTATICNLWWPKTYHLFSVLCMDICLFVPIARENQSLEAEMLQTDGIIRFPKARSREPNESKWAKQQWIQGGQCEIRGTFLHSVEPQSGWPLVSFKKDLSKLHNISHATNKCGSPPPEEKRWSFSAQKRIYK